MMLRPLIALVLAAASGACVARSEDPTSAYLAPGLRFATPPPRALGYSIEVRQLITARYGGELQSFEGILSIAGDRLQLINLDGFGRRAMTIERTGNALTYAREPWVPESLNPANILADIAMIYWPAEAVRAGLAGSTATLATGTRERLIVMDGKEIIRIDYESGEDQAWDGQVHYRNSAFGYELNLRSAVIRR